MRERIVGLLSDVTITVPTAVMSGSVAEFSIGVENKVDKGFEAVAATLVLYLAMRAGLAIVRASENDRNESKDK